MNVKNQIACSVLLLAISVVAVGCCHDCREQRTKVTTTTTEAQPVRTTSTTTTPV